MKKKSNKKIIKVVDNYEDTIASAVKEVESWPKWKLESIRAGFSDHWRDSDNNEEE
jgi:hypothetical protein